MICRLQQDTITPRYVSKGFTLLELLIVIFLAGIILSSAISLLVSPSDQKRLESQISKVEQLGRQARGLAVLQQRPYKVTFSLNQLRLEPLGYREESVADVESDFVGKGDLEDITEILELDTEVQFSVKHWQQDWFLLEDEKDSTDWVFEPNGLVEPISVKVVYDRSWIQQTFHSLTGEVSEEEREVY